MHEPLDNHISAIRTRRHDARLLDGAVVAERTVPAALEWVRRWGPAREVAVLPRCGCDAGRCASCN